MLQDGYYKMSIKVLLISWGCHMQDFLLTAGILGLFPDALLMGKGHLLESRCLRASLTGTHILIARLFFSFALLITVSCQEKGLAAARANKCWCSKFLQFFPYNQLKVGFDFFSRKKPAINLNF